MNELSNLALCPTKALPGPILGPATGRWTQFVITIIDPSNICFFLSILTHTVFFDQWNDSRIDQQADAQNVRCRASRRRRGTDGRDPRAFYNRVGRPPEISRVSFVKNPQKIVKSLCLQHHVAENRGETQFWG